MDAFTFYYDEQCEGTEREMETDEAELVFTVSIRYRTEGVDANLKPPLSVTTIVTVGPSWNNGERIRPDVALRQVIAFWDDIEQALADEDVTRAERLSEGR